jgi:hypothetical protein
MATVAIELPPCGTMRANCRLYLAKRDRPDGICQLHTAWCPDDFDSRPHWVVTNILDQRAYRTGG